MPKFPKSEADIFKLGHEMLSGYSLHMADFPSVDAAVLSQAFNDYLNSTGGYLEAHAKAKLATEAKNTRLTGLRDIMKNCLKKSHVDAADSPEKLALIGWGPKAVAQMIEAPSAPVSLRAAGQGKGTIRLLWKNPSGGGAVRNYNIQRREQLTEGDFSSWSIVASALETEIDLTNQPQGIELEYRIKAVNTGGQSMSSNTAAVVL